MQFVEIKKILNGNNMLQELDSIDRFINNKFKQAFEYLPFQQYRSSKDRTMIKVYLSDVNKTHYCIIEHNNLFKNIDNILKQFIILVKTK